jgi:hypothetical protein
LKTRTRSLTVATVVAVAAGFSSVLLSAAPASATPFTCGLGGTSIGGGVCELTYNAGTATFTPPVGTTKLEALLVGGGGDASYGYSYGGGGGQVTLQNFADTTTAVDIVVGADDQVTTTTQGATVTTANFGEDSNNSWPVGGASGNGNLSTSFGGAGAGAGTTTNDGGAGQIVSALASGTSLFAGDPNCYGGGGATQSIFDGTFGLATCGGGAAVASTITPAVANSGGGGGASDTDWADGASGVVVVRWLTTAPVNLTFVMNGHGVQVPLQVLVTGTTAALPTPPSATGTAFLGWYSDPALTTKFDFSTAINADTVVYASWATLAETGVSVSPWTIPGAGGVVALGLAMLVFSRRRFGRSRS